MLRRVPRADSQNLGAEGVHKVQWLEAPPTFCPSPWHTSSSIPGGLSLLGKQPELGWLTRISSGDGKVLSAASEAVATRPHVATKHSRGG